MPLLKHSSGIFGHIAVLKNMYMLGNNLFDIGK